MSSSDILIVGEMPSARGNGSPFSGPSGDRLTNHIGYGLQWFSLMDAVNLMPEGEWTAKEAKAVGMRMREKLGESKEYRVVLLAGRKVAHAFGFHRNEPFFKRFVRRSVHYYIIPHPSGKNRWWNDRSNRAKFSAFAETVILDMEYPG